MDSKNEWRKKNAVCLFAAAALYLFNRTILKKAPGSVPGAFFRYYLNDLLCPLVVIPAVQLLLSLAGLSMKRLWALLLFISGCGLVWEILIPMIRPASVSDPLDLVCYLAGTMVYYLLVYRSRNP